MPAIDKSPQANQARSLAQIAMSLESIASNISREFGPFKPQKMWNPSEEMQKRSKEIEESNRRETEIDELKKSNKIAVITARVAVVGLVFTAIVGILQLLLNYYEFRYQMHTSSLERTSESTPSMSN